MKMEENLKEREEEKQKEENTKKREEEFTGKPPRCWHSR